MKTREHEVERFISQYLRSQFFTPDTPEDECDQEAHFIMEYLKANNVILTD